MRQLENVVLVEFNPALPSAGSQFVMPRHGALTVGSKLKEAGYNVTYLYEPLVDEITSKKIMSFNPDLVAFTAISPAISKVESVARELSNEGVEILLGGEHASITPGSVDFADYIIVKEGEQIAVQLLEALKNEKSIDNIPNLIHRQNGGYVENASIEPSQLPFDYKYDLNIVEGFSSMTWFQRQILKLPLQTTRGCPRVCNFCVTEDLFGKGYRRREFEPVLLDIEEGLKYDANSFMVVDNSFGMGKKTNLLEAIISEDYGAKLTALVTADVSKNRHVVELMRRAGITNVSLGIESTDNDVLTELNKSQEINDVIEAIKVFHDHGISVLGLFMVGANYDTVDTVRRIPDFALENNIDKIQIASLTFLPPPSRQSSNGYNLIPGIPFDYYNGHFVTLFPQNMRPSVMQREIGDAYDKFYSVPNTLSAITHAGRGVNALRGKAAVGYVMRKIIGESVREQGHIEF
ncbi:radical SAM protein [archaeon]|nr:radical SAM protein [archaeon]